MSKYVIRFWPFTALDYRYAEKYLEKKAENGLLFDGLSDKYMPIAWYKKTVPAKVKFCTDGFKHQAYIEEDQKKYNEYLEMAQKSGWHHIYEKNYMQYFVSNNDSNPVPIHTDPETEFEAIKKVYKKSEMPLTLIILFVTIFIDHIDGEHFIREAFNRFSILTAWAIAVAVLSIGLMRYLIFIRRGSKAILKREEICDANDTLIKVWGGLYNLVIFIIMASIFIQLYFSPFKEYARTGNLVALYCGIILFISLCLLEVDSILKHINIQPKKPWNIFLNFGLGGFILSVIIYWISVIFF